MYRFLLMLLLLACADVAGAQSPHGDDFKMDCAACHSSDSWEVPMDKWFFEEEPKRFYSEITGTEMPADTSKFNHYQTDFPIEGGHLGVDCRVCHSSLVFSEADISCISCHTDMHAQSVGSDCARCHNVNNWLVDDIPELHEQNGFPLIGAHDNLSCVDCHISETNIRFDRIGNDCINCHQADYSSVQSPNHEELGFSINCVDCHDPLGEDWATDVISHDFFPLTMGHDIQDCSRCHLSPNYGDISSDCISCHQDDFINALNPNHQAANFSTDCIQCHTTNPDWMPATFITHDEAYFPIYSGSHEGEWSDCIDCHTNPNNFAEFSCTNCHTNPETNNEHNGIPGYIYESNACFSCHPTGDGDGNFDHDGQYFPIYSGSHEGEWNDCIDCHTNPNNFAEFSCTNCHMNPETNNDHNGISGYFYESNACLACHPTGDGEGSFDHNTTNFPLTGGHIGVECLQCHEDGYAGTPTDCNACHAMDFAGTQNPNHTALNLSTDCASCHTTEPSWMPASFDNHNDFHPLNGAHAMIANDCAACHNGDYVNTPNTCFGCHQSDYNNTNNPNHSAAQFPTDCTPCHSESAWSPSTFNHDGMYFPIYSGKHDEAWNQCTECHTTPNDFSTFSCIQCHEHSNQSDVNNDHDEVSGYIYESNACYACHPDGDDG